MISFFIYLILAVVNIIQIYGCVSFFYSTESNFEVKISTIFKRKKKKNDEKKEKYFYAFFLFWTNLLIKSPNNGFKIIMNVLFFNKKIDKKRNFSSSQFFRCKSLFSKNNFSEDIEKSSKKRKILHRFLLHPERRRLFSRKMSYGQWVQF